MDEDYEIIPQQEIQRLKEEVDRLRKEKTTAPSAAIASSLDRLASSLEKLFRIFEVAATDLEQEKIEEKSFDEKIRPIFEKLSSLEDQNKDIAEGILALAELVKKREVHHPQPRPVPPRVEPYGYAPITPPPMMREEMPPPPPPMPSEMSMEMPPRKPGFAERFR